MFRLALARRATAASFQHVHRAIPVRHFATRPDAEDRANL